ncbi:MAG: ABC transporter permease [Pseudomonadota bacterium]
MPPIFNIIVQRIALGVLTLFIVSVLIFIGVEALPGDLAEAILGQLATPDALAALREKLGLDRPAPERYLEWVNNALHGDFGNSLATGRDVVDMISGRLSNTLFLAGVSALVAIPIALCLGICAALYRESRFDKMASALTLCTISFPEYFVGYILIVLLAVELQLFPSFVRLTSTMDLWERLYAITLPVLTLVLIVIAHMMRMTRAAVINVLAAPYIEMARLKGIRKKRIILHHALPNALSPIITVVALNLAFMVVGVVLIEVVFVYPGLGQLLVDSVAKRDLPVVQASCLIFAATYILLNLLSDVISTLANPRLRHSR